MKPERPDLSTASPELRAYIEALEAEVERLRGPRSRAAATPVEPEPSEPPTTLNVITISTAGVAKRTPRHHYGRQRRGGMGVFDLETSGDDVPAFLLVADESEHLLLVTSRARAFRLPVASLSEAPVRGRGAPLTSALALTAEEHLAAVTVAGGGSFLILVSERGQVRRFGAHLFGPAMRIGAALYDVRDGGPPAALCWSGGSEDLFIATRQGKAIRFAEQLTPVRGCLGIRLERDDTVCAVAAVNEGDNVFLLGADGKGTLRQMSGFRANKATGASGKTAMNTDSLVSALRAGENDDLFILSRLSKIIRFQAAEVPAKEGVVQGVNCMELRADETVAATASH